MTRTTKITAAFCCVLLGLAGCTTSALFYQPPPPPEMLGTKVDQINQLQEENAEAAKFVIYQHEFEDVRYVNNMAEKVVRLNEYGEDHVRQIAAALRAGAPLPVVVERSETSARTGTKYEYPVHFNPELDMQRRELIVRALGQMGIADADTRVVVAPAFSQPLTGVEATSAYAAGISGWGGGGGGWGGGMGGGMGGGWGGGWQ